jgi:hypothetical protein
LGFILYLDPVCFSSNADQTVRRRLTEEGENV